MDKPVGGRGKQAPYVSTHVRIPEPIKDKVEELKQIFFEGKLEEYYQSISDNHDLAIKHKDRSPNKTDLSKDELIVLARKILKQKKSAKITALKLLTALLGQDISLDDLE